MRRGNSRLKAQREDSIGVGDGGQQGVKRAQDSSGGLEPVKGDSKARSEGGVRIVRAGQMMAVVLPVAFL